MGATLVVGSVWLILGRGRANVVVAAVVTIVAVTAIVIVLL